MALTLTMAAGSAALLAPWGASRTALVADPRLVQVAHAAAGGVSADSARTLDNLVRLSPNDAVLHLLHADQARGQGLEATAAAGYRRATELDPALGAAANNAGALYFSLGRFATASGHFRRAIEAEPDNMAAYYNLYLAQERRFDFAAAEKTLMEARGRNLDAMTALLSQRGSDDERLDVVEARVPVATALAHARRALNLDQSATSLSASAGGGTAAVILPLLAWVVAVWRLRSRNLPQRCAACGAIACRQCTLHMEDRERCAPCSHLAGRTTSLPRNVRERKRLEAASWRRSSARRCRIAAALLPGGGQLWGGRPVLGVLLLAIACCGAASLLLSRVLPGVGSLPAVPEAVAAGVIGPFLLMAPWAAGWLYAFQGRRSAHGGGR